MLHFVQHDTRALLQLALRLANTLNHLAPVFAEPNRP